MIVVTGAKGFIGQNFLKHLLKHSNEKIITVNESDAWDWICLFKDWDKVSLILHQGAIASTTETDVDKLMNNLASSWQDKSGFFFYQKTSSNNFVKIPFTRWTQGWTALALAYWYEK